MPTTRELRSFVDTKAERRLKAQPFKVNELSKEVWVTFNNSLKKISRLIVES